jgi:pimeloyl-ACP methyl ester carboxylesterase
MTAVVVALGAVTCAALLRGAETAPVALKTTEFGRGPTVVLLHALGSGRMVWMPTARKLLANHHVVMVDLPGHGESGMPDPFSIAACAEALDQVLAKQKGDSTVLIAHGMGGLLALQEAQTHPERLKGLVVIDAATRFPTPIPDDQQQFFLRMLDSNYDEIIKGMMMRQGRDSTQGNELYAAAQQVRPAVMKAYLRAAMNADVSPALKKLKPAFLFVGSEKLWGDKDWAAVAKQMGYDDPAAVTARRVGGSGPLIMKEQPDSLSALIAEFTAKVIAAK